MTTNPIFNTEDLKTIEQIVATESERLFPSSFALQRALDSFPQPQSQYRCVGVGADPQFLGTRGTNIDIRVRKDQVDSFVRHLATVPEIHTVKVQNTVVYRRPEPTDSGIDEDALASKIA